MKSCPLILWSLVSVRYSLPLVKEITGALKLPIPDTPLAVVWEEIQPADPLILRPVTAFETPPKRTRRR